MSVNIKLPKTGEFDSIEYVELGEREATELIETYNKQAVGERLQLLIENRMKKNEEKSNRKFFFVLSIKYCTSKKKISDC